MENTFVINSQMQQERTDLQFVNYSYISSSLIISLLSLNFQSEEGFAFTSEMMVVPIEDS